MRKIWPSQDNCIQLKDKFASCEFGTPTCEIKAQLAKVILQLVNLELNVRKWILSCEINLRNFRKSPCNVRNWDICAPTLLDLFFRYFCINFHSSPFNPPTIRFISQEGWKNFSIYIPLHPQKYIQKYVIQISYIESTNRALALFFIYILVFSLVFFLANQTLRIFPQRMRGQALRLLK